MSYAEDRILDVLRKYASEPTARGMLRRAKEEIGLVGSHVPADLFERLRSALDVGLRVFVAPHRHELASEELRQLERAQPALDAAVLPIADEHQCRRARISVRQRCQTSGASDHAALIAVHELTDLVSSAREARRSELGVRIAIAAGEPPLLSLTLVDLENGEAHDERVVALPADAAASQTGCVAKSS